MNRDQLRNPMLGNQVWAGFFLAKLQMGVQVCKQVKQHKQPEENSHWTYPH